MNTWVYIQSEPTLWTVGFFDPSGKWQPDSDHSDREGAAKRVHWLNGGQEQRELTECEKRECTYHTHYLLWYDPAKNGPRLDHETYHVAEQHCTVAQERLIKWMDDHESGNVPQHLVRLAELWERRVCA